MRIGRCATDHLEHAVERGEQVALCGAEVSASETPFAASRPHACPACARKRRATARVTRERVGMRAGPGPLIVADLDRRFSRMIRSAGRCAAAGDGLPCRGPLECAHLISCSHRATRWDEANAVALCRGHHIWYTARPTQWADWIEDRIGEAGVDELKRRARSGAVPDYDALRDRLAGRRAAS